MTQTGDQIRDWRIKNKLSQAELASQMGCSQAIVSYIEKGTAFPSKRLLLLFEGEGLTLNENNKESLIKEISRLGPNDAHKVADYVDLIINRNYVKWR